MHVWDEIVWSKVVGSMYNPCMAVEMNEETTIHRRHMGDYKNENWPILECGMLFMFVMGSRKCLQISSVVPSDQTKMVLFFVTTTSATVG